jgi:hypothetical protein
MPAYELAWVTIEASDCEVAQANFLTQLSGRRMVGLGMTRPQSVWPALSSDGSLFERLSLKSPV